MAKLLNISYRGHGRVLNKFLHILPAEISALRVGSRNVQSAAAAALTPKLQSFIEKNVALCQPDKVHICDGSEAENEALVSAMVKLGTLEPLPKYKNCWLARTDPQDVARVESRTFMSTENKSDTVPSGSATKCTLGNWISPDDLNKEVQERFPGCMKGRTMYVVPFSMGPITSPLAKLGVELTDSPYVAASMRIMTRMGSSALQAIQNGSDFIECLHSVGRSAESNNPWPCEPERTIIAHKPASNEIISYGSGYGGNSLLGKKCLALRIGSTIAKREGWLAEHMLILGITNPQGVKRYIAGAFPSACGKTNLAMLTPTLPGYKVECVGDDIAWMKFDSEGRLRAINPENGFFGVAPGTSYSTNPNAMKTIFKNTVFTNVAKTSDGGVYWEGMEMDSNVQVTDWRGQPWTKENGKNAAHPNSRFCTPAGQCPIIDPAWESPEGVPIDAILFGGRRPQGVPLVYEAFDWKHGVFVGAAMRSEATAAAEFKGKVIMHDPFAMRPFFGYNFGHYLNHWLNLEKTAGREMPKIFHVNWFRKNAQGKFLWPGFGDNVRVLEWVLNRLEGNDAIAEKTAIGYIPSEGAMNLEGLSEPVDTKELFSVPKEFWLSEVEQIKKYFDEQVGSDLPNTIAEQLHQLRNRVDSM